MFYVFDRETGRELSGPTNLPAALQAMRDACEAGVAADVRKLLQETTQ